MVADGVPKRYQVEHLLFLWLIQMDALQYLATDLRVKGVGPEYRGRIAFQVIDLALLGASSVGLILVRSEGVRLGLFSVAGRLGLGWTASVSDSGRASQAHWAGYG